MPRRKQKRSHDGYGKNVLKGAAGEKYCNDKRAISFGKNGGKAYIDGTVNSRVAVEIESREPKQVRGAMMDLILHCYKKKLLVLIPRHHNKEEVTAQADYIFKQFNVKKSHYRVVVLKGSGGKPRKFLKKDASAVREALKKLKVNFLRR